MHAFILFVGLLQEPQPTRGIPIWLWLVIILVLIALILWWVRRSTRLEPVKPSEMPRTTTVSTFTAPDDLVIIEGIGPKIAATLKDAGITTFAQLAEADVSRLRTILDSQDLQMIDPESWSEQARLAASGDMAALKTYQDALKGGRQV